jgi:hypothetical protein
MTLKTTATVAILVLTVIPCTSYVSNSWKCVDTQPTEIRLQKGKITRNEINQTKFLKIQITGEVYRPGRFIWQKEMTLGSVITASGGFTDFAGHFVWTSQYSTAVTVSTSKYRAEPKWADMQVKPGDSILVDRVCRF